MNIGARLNQELTSVWVALKRGKVQGSESVAVVLDIDPWEKLFSFVTHL